MNRNIRWYLLGLCMVFVSAHGTPLLQLQINSSGELTGATGVDVDGLFYNFSLEQGSCVELYAGCNPDDFPFRTESVAEDAANALIQNVFIDSPNGNFAIDLDKITGCNPGVVGCIIFIPVPQYGGEIPGIVHGTCIVIHPPSPLFGGEGCGFGAGDDTPLLTGDDYAVFAPLTTAPEPGTLALLGLGFISLVGARRKRSSTAH